MRNSGREEPGRAAAGSGWLVSTLILMLFAGCTVAPKAPVDGRASFDGNEQNSGVIGRLPDGGDYVVTAHWRARYLALTPRAGHFFNVAATNDFGIQPFTNGTFRADAQRMVQMGAMNLFVKSGAVPPPLK